MTLAGCLSFVRDTPITAIVLGLKSASRFVIVSIPFLRIKSKRIIHPFNEMQNDIKNKAEILP
jgi:hypothetical protein